MTEAKGDEIAFHVLDWPSFYPATCCWSTRDRSNGKRIVGERATSAQHVNPPRGFQLAAIYGNLPLPRPVANIGALNEPLGTDAYPFSVIWSRSALV